MDKVFFSPRGDASPRRRRPSDVTPFDVPYLTTTHRDPSPPHPLRRKPKTYFYAGGESVPRKYKSHADFASREAPYTRKRRSPDVTPYDAAYTTDARTGSSPQHLLRRKAKTSNLRLENISSAPSSRTSSPAKSPARNLPVRGSPTRESKALSPQTKPRPLPSTPAMGGRTIRHVGKSSDRLVDREGKIKRHVIFVGIKPDLEADIKLDAKVRGSIEIGLY